MRTGTAIPRRCWPSSWAAASCSSRAGRAWWRTRCGASTPWAWRRRGSWEERWTDVRSHDLLNWTVPKRYQEAVEELLSEGLNEAVRTGTCRLDGHRIWLATFDFGFVGGTLSIVAGERLARGMEQAASSGTPYVLVAASGVALSLARTTEELSLARAGAISDAFFSRDIVPSWGGHVDFFAQALDGFVGDNPTHSSSAPPAASTCWPMPRPTSTRACWRRASACRTASSACCRPCASTA